MYLIRRRRANAFRQALGVPLALLASDLSPEDSGGVTVDLAEQVIDPG
jgi:hypothetical protein